GASAPCAGGAMTLRSPSMAPPVCTWIVHAVLAGTAIDTSVSWPPTSGIGLTRQSWAPSTVAIAIAHTLTIDRPTKAAAETVVGACASSPSSTERRTRVAICAAGAAGCRSIWFMRRDYLDCGAQDCGRKHCERKYAITNAMTRV